MKYYLLPALSAFAVCLLTTALLLPLLRKKKAGQEILQYVTEHSGKQGTPTMGGIAFILTILTTTWSFCGTLSRPLALSLAATAAYGVVGFLDDFLKIRFKHNLGLKAYQKILFQLAIAVVIAIVVYRDPTIGDKLYVPFTSVSVNVGWWTIPLVIFIFLACTNGVNLTDGLDGLAASSVLCYLVAMFAIVLTHGNAIGGVSEQNGQLLTLMAASIGALAAFLLFNCFPAKVFMGDVGSLALGALVACVSIFTNRSLFIPILGLTFVFSCVSVILQVVYFKVSGGKRIFLMAPFHHHLQKKGLSEVRVGVIYSAVTLTCGALLLIFGG